MASVARLALFPSEALTASANGSSKNTEPVWGQFIGWIKASSVNAATTVAAKIQHSPNGTDWKDLTSFANIVGADGSEALQITSNILPFARAVVTLSGATQAATVEISLYYDKVR